jgi:colicin import membrane protein
MSVALSTPSTQRLEFAPLKTPGASSALVLALMVHALLIAALTFSVQWKHQTDTPAIETELWASVPSLAAPKAQALPEPAPVIQPKPTVVTPPPAPEADDALIVLERRKKRETQRAQALVQEEKEKVKRLAAEQTAKADKTKEAAAKKEADAEHDKQVKRLQAMAGASGDASATGATKQSSGPSASYGNRIAALIKRNSVFSENIPGNPEAEVEFRTAPDGSIVGTPKLTKSSGFKAWDDAVINAILKTEKIPRDSDGRVPPVIILGFTPKDR